MKSFELISAEDYAQALAVRIPAAKQRIVIAVMAMTWSEVTAPLFAELLAAQKRGVQVHLLYDRYSWLPFAFNKALSSAEIRRRVKHLLAWSEAFQAQGGRITLVGEKWSVNPFKNRQHVKITLIDNTVYSFGGVNFTDDSFEVTDYMLKTEDQNLAAKLEAVVGRTATGLPQQDQTRPIDEKSSFLFDGGLPGQSVIYERACHLAEKAANVHLVSQMCPSGRLARLLQDKATCYFNRPGQVSTPGNLALAFDQWRGHMQNSYTRAAYIHAKFILFEMPGGQKVLLSGSHNFSWRGVAYGAKEIALESRNKALWNQLNDFINTEVK